MRICKVYDDDYPWDVRVEKIGRALTAAGHEVFLASRNRARTSTLFEDVDTMQVRRMSPYPWIRRSIDAQLMFPAFFSPRWLGHIREVVRRNECDLILVRDLPLALAGIAIARLERIPVVVDLAENYPAALRAFQQGGNVGTFDRVARNPGLAEWVERRVAHHADHCFVVCDEMIDKIVGLGAAPERVSLVGNTPDLDRFVFGERGDDGDGFTMLYTGEVHPYRGVQTALEALPAILQEIPDARLVVVGDGEAVPVLRARAESLGIADRLDLRGFRPHAELPDLIAAADVCLIPHLRNEHIDSTLPNKLFDAMAMGTPVLVSDARPLARVVEECGCGASYLSGNVEDFARAALSLRHREERRRMGASGRRAVVDRYNWAEDVRTLLGVIEGPLRVR